MIAEPVYSINEVAAKTYATQFKWQVFPVKPRGKEPLTEHGYKDGTLDQLKIEAFWPRHSDANVAVVTGQVSGFFVVDVDPRNGGDKSFRELENEFGSLPKTIVQDTGGGGFHLLFKHPGGKIPNRKGLRPGIDIKGDGGYIIAHPSIHESGKQYTWKAGSGPGQVSLAAAPKWLLDLVVAPSKSQTNLRTKTKFKSAEEIAEALGGRRSGAGWICHCPAHEDRKPSFSVGEQDGKVLFHCFSGCDQGRVIEALRHKGLWGHAERNFRVRPTFASVELQGWGDVISLEERQIKPISLSLFPKLISDFVNGVSQATETPPELAAMMTLGVLSMATTGKFEIETEHGHFEPVNLYLICALESGNRKTSVMNLCKEPLEAWERTKQLEAAPEIRKALAKRKNEEAQVKSLRAQLGKDPAKDQKLKNQIESLEINLTHVPRSPRLLAADVTPERLASLMAEQGDRIGLFSDEGGIFDLLAGRYNKGAPNLDLYLKSYDGSSCRVDRQSAEAIVLHRPLITTCLCPQPSIIQSLSERPDFRNRGLVARFLYAVPGSPIGFRSGKTVPIPSEDKSAFDALIFKFLEMNPSPETSFKLSLSGDAYRLWKDFFCQNEIKLRDGGKLGVFRDWGSKLPGTIARVCALFHLVENLGSFDPTAPVDEKTMLDAISLADLFEDHALKAFDLMSLDSKLQDAKHVLSWIRRTQMRVLSQRECHRSLHRHFKGAEHVSEVLKILSEHNYLREIEDGPVSHRPSRRFEVNPAVLEIEQ